VTQPLILASASPRRRELLDQIAVSYSVQPADIDESRQAGESALDFVSRTALHKARAVAAHSSAVVMGADTIGLLDGDILMKPQDEQHAADMLRAMSGREHEVVTAVALVAGEREATVRVSTRVCFREISDLEIARYWRTGEPVDKAGGYAIQGMGAVFVTGIIGSYSNVVGLPLYETADLLRQFDISAWQLQD
jgi:septum formation protein